VAALLGTAVGYERERQNQPAGLRTHIILVVGSALAMTVSINLAVEFGPVAPGADPARLAAQVISGVGFLGAGAILRFGLNVRGLTTATSLWTMSVVGLAAGAGFYGAAVGTTALLLLALLLLGWVEDRFVHPYVTLVLQVEVGERPGATEQVQDVLAKGARKFSPLSITRTPGKTEMRFEVVLKPKDRQGMQRLTEELMGIEGVLKVSAE
jgi:putative Mg2+ transporter-C (MgtC) family protein